MDEQDYKQFVNTVANNDNLTEEDFTFLSDYFEKPLNIVIADVIQRRTTLQLAWDAGKHLN